MASMGCAERRRRLLLCALAVAAGGRLAAEILPAGSFQVVFPFFNGGGTGTALQGGGAVLVASIGQGAATAMTGGGVSLESCLGGCVSPSASPTQQNLDSAHAFPVPFRPSLGHDRITFRGLTARATVRIYTLSAELVATLTKDDPTSGDLVWRPVVNSAGEPIASGVYLYLIDGSPGRAKGKLMVIK